MAEPSDGRGETETEAEEIDREMEMIEREGGGAAEAGPVRRLAFLLLAVMIAALAFWYFSRG
jgi:hypothetical protein